jgi:hypothetical protein
MFATDGYYVNQFTPVRDCSELGYRLSGYGLVVGSSATNIKGISVRGAALLPSDANTDQVTQLVSTCPVTTSMGTGRVRFPELNTDARSVSRAFANYQPSLYLDKNNNLVTIGSRVNGYDVITMQTCKNGPCSIVTHTEQLSYPGNIFYGLGEWNGPVGQEWPSKLIINVRVYHQLGLLEELVR